MIIDLDRFIVQEKGYWEELEGFLEILEREPARGLELERIKRFHYLYQRTSADLAKIMTFSSQPEVGRYLEALVERAYAEIHETREKPYRLNPRQWFLGTLPRTFRRRLGAFWLALAVTLAGCAFGGLAVSLDPEAKQALMPFEHLRLDPSERVAQEEGMDEDRLRGRKARFSAFLMTHNIKVSISALALGMTLGVGTLIVLFGNGVVLGAVALDYILAGEARFLLGWLLPHGVVEIPAILLAGQAGLILAGALIGRGRPDSMKERLRKVSGDLVTLIFGVALFLVWAGFIEAFLSQYHEPTIPYEAKIIFGLTELALLTLFLWKSGRGKSQDKV